MKVMVTPRTRARETIATLTGQSEVIVFATEPSAIEAAVLITAGANAYVTSEAELGDAVTALGLGDTWFSAVAATAVCRLARLTRDPALHGIAIAARAAAAGQPWPAACHAAGLTTTQSHLHRLRRRL